MHLASDAAAKAAGGVCADDPVGWDAKNMEKVGGTPTVDGGCKGTVKGVLCDYACKDGQDAGPPLACGQDGKWAAQASASCTPKKLFFRFLRRHSSLRNPNGR